MKSYLESQLNNAIPLTQQMLDVMTINPNSSHSYKEYIQSKLDKKMVFISYVINPLTTRIVPIFSDEIDQYALCLNYDSQLTPSIPKFKVSDLKALNKIPNMQATIW